jgi:hypothetical protein
MNRYGKLDLKARGPKAPVFLGGGALRMQGVKMLDVRMEIQAEAGDLLIPASLRPAIPSYGSIAISCVAESEVGPFNMAALRVGVRVGAVPAFFVLGAICSTDEACEALSARFGYPITAGVVELKDAYHQVAAHVAVGGRTAAKLRLMDRKPLPGTRLNLNSLITLARQGEGGPLTLLNIPVEASWGAVDGGRQVLDAFNPEAFGADQAFRPAFPMSAAHGTVDLTLQSPDVAIDPEIPAEESVRAVA